MRSRLSNPLMAVLVAIILIAMLVVGSWAVPQVVSALKVGAGGARVLGGTLRMQTAAGVDKTTIDGATGNTVIGGTLGQSLVNAAGGGANPYDYTGTLGIMDGSDDFTLFDVNVTNANHTGSSNTVQAIDIAGITGDAQATETAISIGAGWDYGMIALSPVSTLRPTTADEGDAATTLTLAAYPSGSVVTSAANTVAITLPAVATSAGAQYTFVMKGSTSFTLTAASACLMCDGQTAAKTNLVWSTTPLYLSVSVVCDGTNWMVTSMTASPDSSS